MREREGEGRAGRDNSKQTGKEVEIRNSWSLGNREDVGNYSTLVRTKHLSPYKIHEEILRGHIFSSFECVDLGRVGWLVGGWVVGLGNGSVI